MTLYVEACKNPPPPQKIKPSEKLKFRIQKINNLVLFLYTINEQPQKEIKKWFCLYYNQKE